MQKQRGFASRNEQLSGFSLHFHRFPLISDGLGLCQSQEWPANHIQIRQRARYNQTVRVLRQSAVAHLGKAKDPLDHPKRMLDLGADFRFGAIGGFLFQGQWSGACPDRVPCRDSWSSWVRR